MGRATFYRLFDNMNDVLSYLCDGVFEQADKEFKKLKISNTNETTLAFIRICMKNKALLKAVADSDRPDLIFRSHMKYLAPKRKDFFREIETDEIQTVYLMTTLTACTSAFLTAWLANGAKESSEQLQERLKKCFNALGKIFE